MGNLRLDGRPVTPALVLESARDVRASIDRVSSMYADLWAIRCASAQSFLPWSADSAAYPFPDHLPESSMRRPARWTALRC